MDQKSPPSSPPYQDSPYSQSLLDSQETSGSVLSISEPEYFLFHSGFSDDKDNDVCLLKIRSNDKIIFIRYSFTLLCSPGHFDKLNSITNLQEHETQEILYKTLKGDVTRVKLTQYFCTEIPEHSPLTVHDIKAEGSTKLNDYDELVIQQPSQPSQKSIFNELVDSSSQLSGISHSRQYPSNTSVYPLVSAIPVTRSTTHSNEFNNLAEIIVDMYGLSHAIQVSLGKLHNSLNSVSLSATFTDVVCGVMETFCVRPTGTGPGSKSFDEWMIEHPDRKNELMCLKSAYVSRAENSCKVHDKPESEIVKKMELVKMNISKTLELRGCTYKGIDSMLTEMDGVFNKHFSSYVSPDAKKGGGVSQEKCRLAITDYQSSFSAAMESFGCPIPRYDRLGEINRTRTSRLENAAKNINLGFDVAMTDDAGAGENIANSMVKNGQALVCDAINPDDFNYIQMIAHLNSSEIDAARLSLNIARPLVILIESPVYDADDGKNTTTQITPIPCNFPSNIPETLKQPTSRELHEGDGGLFVFLSIPWFEPDHYKDTHNNWFGNLKPEQKSKVIRPIICVYKITASFPPNEGYDDATNALCHEFIQSLNAEHNSLTLLNSDLFKDCRVPEIRPSITRLGVKYSFVFGITTTRSGVSNNLTLALILPHLAEGGGAKCFRGTCDVGACKQLLEHSGCSYLQPRHFNIMCLQLLSLTELNFLLGLILKEYGDSTKAVCADIMRSTYKIPTVLASVDWCLLLRQFEGVAAFRSDNVYKICGTTELKPLELDEIRKIATLQALFMCYPDKDTNDLITENGVELVLTKLCDNEAAAAAAAGRSYDVFQTHIGNKIQEHVIRRIDDSLDKFQKGATMDVLPDYCEFVLFHSKLKSSTFLVERDKFIGMMSKPVTSHGHHVCHDMLDFFDKYVIDTRKIDSFEYERMKLMKVKEEGAIEKLLEQLISVPIHNPLVQKLLLKRPPESRDNPTIIKQTESDLVGVFSNCSLFELLSLVSHYEKNNINVIFKIRDGPTPSSSRPAISLPVNRVKELLRPSLWSVFHEFFGADCGISNYDADQNISKIKSVLLGAGCTYLSPDDIVRIREARKIVEQVPESRVPVSYSKAPSTLKATPQSKQTPRRTPDPRGEAARGKLSSKAVHKTSRAASSVQAAVTHVVVGPKRLASGTLKATPQSKQTHRGTPEPRGDAARGKLSSKVEHKKPRAAGSQVAVAHVVVGSKRPAPGQNNTNKKKGGSRKKRTRTYKKMNRRSASALTRKRRTRRKL